jgi:hypothetical protein
MASTRVTADEVQEIMDTTVADTNIGACITAANLIVNEYLSNQNMSAALLKELERWLAAHLLAMSLDPQDRNVRIGETEVRFEGQFGYGLDHTRFGQVVKTLDSSGNLANSSKPKALFTVLSETDE